MNFGKENVDLYNKYANNYYQASNGEFISSDAYEFQNGQDQNGTTNRGGPYKSQFGKLVSSI